MDEKDKLLYDQWIQHKKDHDERTFYSQKRMDILLITISGAGLYSIIDFAKNTENISALNHTWLLVVSTISLLLAIVINFIAQSKSSIANSKESDYAQLEINDCMGEEVDEKSMQSLRCQKKCLINQITYLSYISNYSMIAGIITLTIFYYLFYF